MHGMPPPGIVDIISLSLVCLSALRGYLRGLSGELAQLISVVSGLVFGVLFHAPVAAWCVAHTRLGPADARAAGFIATVTGAIAVVVLIRVILKRVMKVVFHHETFDRIGGLIAGFARACVVLAIVFLAMNLAPHEYLNRKFGKESVIGTLLIRQAPLLRENEKEPWPK